MKALIIGGGIAGLSAAAAFQRAGIGYQVFEQASELREIGAGLTVWVNAVTALEKLGVTNALLELGSRIETIEVRTWDGHVLNRTPLYKLDRDMGVPGSFCVHRADLLRELARMSDPRAVQCGARCCEICDEGSHVVARFEDGRKACADFLVGADGLHSVVRRHLRGESPPRYAGYTCWRALAERTMADLPKGVSFESWGKGARFSAHHCGRGRTFWYATLNSLQNRPDHPAGRKAEVLRCFRNWHDPICELITATDESAILRNDIVDRPPVSSWGRGRITLVGDAAHPTTPNLGQGACLAIEDAVVLTEFARKAADAETALRRYERKRQPRTAMITNQSRRLGSVCQIENSFAIALRNFGARMFPEQISLYAMRKLFHCELAVIRNE